MSFCLYACEPIATLKSILKQIPRDSWTVYIVYVFFQTANVEPTGFTMRKKAKTTNYIFVYI